MNEREKTKWNQRYAHGVVGQPEAADILVDNQHLLSDKGSALDIACGLGGNAFCLAKNGLETSAWDISSVVISQLNEIAQQLKLDIDTAVRDVVQSPPEIESFDVIVVSRFLERTFFPVLKTAIKPGGLIFYQTFIKDKAQDSGPNNPDYLLETNELLSYFSDWIIRVYREEGSIGNTSKGFRNQAGLIAQKPD